MLLIVNDTLADDTFPEVAEMDVDPAACVADTASTTSVETLVIDSEGGEDGDETPALFVTSMPRDVWANPSLGALAALIDEADEEQDDEEVHQGRAQDGSDEGSSAGDSSNISSGSCGAALLAESGTALPTISEEAAFPPRNGNNPPTNLLSSSGINSSSGSNSLSGFGRQRREELRRRRNDRRASPYPAARPGRGENSITGGGRGAGAVRKGPTAGEAQVLMSLWGL